MTGDDDDNKTLPPAPLTPGDDDRTRMISMAPDGAAVAEQPPNGAAPAHPAAVPPELTPPHVVKKNRGTIVPGTVINNNYRIVSLLGAGGMGEVYSGDALFGGPPVAIKMVHRNLASDPKVMALFEREAAILASLYDPAIVRYFNAVYDAETELFCLIMEYVDGMPLDRWVHAHGVLNEKQAAALMIRLADGLARAHEANVVHRDLSPDNVMLRDGDLAKAVLIDFGIAKSNEDRGVSLAGELAGKFKYMSPEQLGDYGGMVGPQADMYGLALLMAAVIVGKPLPMGGNVVEAVNARRQIPDLSGIPPRLRPLFAHMLEPDPAQRPASMRDVVRLLKNPTAVPAKYRLGKFIEGGTMGGHGGPSATTPGKDGQSGRGSVVADVSIEEKSSTGKWLALLAVLAVAGAGGFAWVRGYIPGVPAPAFMAEAPPPDEAPAEPAEASVPTPPADLPQTRETFLASAVTSDCAYVARLPVGRYAGLLEGYSGGVDSLNAVAEAYADAYGGRPRLILRRVAQPQCAAVDFAHAVQAWGADPIGVAAATEMIRSGGSMAGTLHDLGSRAVWMALVADDGRIYDLTGNASLDGAGGGQFSVGLQFPQTGTATRYLVLTVATDQPLVSTVTLQGGAQAADVLPAIQAEIAGRQGGGAAVTLSSLLLDSTMVPPPR